MTAALDYAGVSASKVGFICNNKTNAALKAFGIVPLPLGGTGAGLPNSYCRLNPTAL